MTFTDLNIKFEWLLNNLSRKLGTLTKRGQKYLLQGYAWLLQPKKRGNSYLKVDDMPH